MVSFETFFVMFMLFIVIPVVFGFALKKSNRLGSIFANPFEIKWRDDSVIIQQDEEKNKETGFGIFQKT